MGGECFWVQHYCNENWWALVWITGVFFLSMGGKIDYWKKMNIRIHQIIAIKLQ